MIAVGISDSIADVLGQFPGHAGHEVRLRIPPGSALFLTASEFRALKEASDQANITTTVETEDPLRRQLALLFGLNSDDVGTPAGPRPVTQSPERSPVAQVPTSAGKPGQIIALPVARSDQSPGATPTDAERNRLGRRPRSVAPSRNEGAGIWTRPVEVGPKGQASASTTPGPAPSATDQEEDRSIARRRTILIVVAALVALLVLIVAGLVIASATLTTATVDLELRSQAVTGSTPVQFVAGRIDETGDPAIVAAKYVTVDVTVETTAPATGVDLVGVTPATGTIQLANPTDQAVDIPAGSTGVGDTGVEFTFIADVQVPPATESAPGEAEVQIETITLGSTANLGAGELSGALDSGVYFSNRLQELTGGTDEEGPVVSEADIEAARSAATDALTEAANQQFAETLQSNVLAIPSSFEVEETGESFSHETGDAADAVTRRGVYAVTALTYAAEELEHALGPAVGESLADAIPDGYELVESTIRVGVPELATGGDDEGEISAVVPIEAQVAATFSPEQESALIERLEGTTDDEAEAILAAEPAVESYAIDLSPGWLARGLPDSADRIEIHVDD